MRSILVVTALLTAQPAFAQVRFIVEPVVARLNDHERRIAELEKRLAPGPFIRNLPPDRHALHAEPSGKRTYTEAYDLAMKLNLPLVAWHGDAICESCLHDTDGEWVNYVGAIAGSPPNSITVGVPDGQGGMDRVATITTWITGDAVHGHVPSVRGALTRWRANRQRTLPAATMTTSMYQGGMMGMSFVSSGSMSGACASCGTSSGGRGLFGRR
jgi:hypothetical protein